MNVFDWVFGVQGQAANARMDICRSCEHFEPKWERCNLCGCFMRFKTAMFESECPAGKWGKINRFNNQGDSNNG